MNRLGLMKDARVLLYCDHNDIIIGKEYLDEQCLLESCGDWDFTLSTFDTKLMIPGYELDRILGSTDVSEHLAIQPSNWSDVCKQIGLHFVTKHYSYRIKKGKKQEFEVKSYEHDATGFEAYLPFSELYNWRIIQNDGNFLKISCNRTHLNSGSLFSSEQTQKSESSHTGELSQYVLFEFATS